MGSPEAVQTSMRAEPADHQRETLRDEIQTEFVKMR
jgi:hypothetical protein